MLMEVKILNNLCPANFHKEQQQGVRKYREEEGNDSKKIIIHPGTQRT